jgi:aryl carrier-like protein
MSERSERILAGIHARFTRHRPVDLDTNFFEAGFTSAMLAAVLADLLDDGFGVSLVDLYRHPTVRALAAALGIEERRAPAALPWQV